MEERISKVMSGNQIRNVIYIVVDAFCYDNLNKRVGNMEVTPFLNGLINRSFCANNMYSQAPYTEASLVTILSGENVLENGGYIFGNNNCKSTLFERFKQKGYTTILGYSPYVYSKAYLRDVDEFYYTRLYSIEPLFLYRFEYFKEKFHNGTLTEEEKEVCEILLGEALDTWIQQTEHILSSNREASLLVVSVKSFDTVQEVNSELKKQKKLFLNNRPVYMRSIFCEWKSHILIKLNTRYNYRKELPLKGYIDKAYSDKLRGYQNKYSKVVCRQPCDLNYTIGTLLWNKNGYKDFKGIVRNYIRYYGNKYLSNYLSSITEHSKTEVSMMTQFAVFLENILGHDKKNEHYLAYIHVQDFHLPSVFHTVDSTDKNQLDEEFQEAFQLLEHMDYNYKGNIIAALSAHYCDCKLRDFFNKLQASLDNDFLFVVTADHGYPSYEYPIRPVVYNQTYTEAFHIPCIIYDSCNEISETESSLLSNMDLFTIIQRKSGIESVNLIQKRNYILSEYGGPGCPDIGRKPIWYTLITEKYRISVECPLDVDIAPENVVSIYLLKSDPLQRFNKLKKMYNSKEIAIFLNIIQNRHLELRRKYGNGKFYSEILKLITD